MSSGEYCSRYESNIYSVAADLTLYFMPATHPQARLSYFLKCAYIKNKEGGNALRSSRSSICTAVALELAALWALLWYLARPWGIKWFVLCTGYHFYIGSGCALHVVVVAPSTKQTKTKHQAPSKAGALAQISKLEAPPGPGPPLAPRHTY